MTWLGPSLMLAGSPFAFGYACYAVKYTGGGLLAVVGLILSVLEFGAICLLLVVGLFRGGN